MYGDDSFEKAVIIEVSFFSPNFSIYSAFLLPGDLYILKVLVLNVYVFIYYFLGSL